MLTVRRALPPTPPLPCTSERRGDGACWVRFDLADRFGGRHDGEQSIPNAAVLYSDMKRGAEVRKQFASVHRV